MMPRFCFYPACGRNKELPDAHIYNMKIRLNEDKEVVAQVRAGLIAKGGYCPCRLGKLPENKCMCEEFRAQIADPEFEGFCHCRLFYKEK